MSKNILHHETTRYGFEFGSMIVTRMCSDAKFGNVISIKATDSDEEIQIRTTPAGRRIEVLRLQNGEVVES